MRTLTKKLRDSGIATPESDRITQVLAKEKRRKKPHKHKWSFPLDGMNYCLTPNCSARRPMESS